MGITLPDVVQAYFEDQEFQQQWSSLATKRDASIPKLQDVTLRFIRAELEMKMFCSQLEKTLRSDEDWGATSFGFMMELNKLNKYHNETSTLAEEHLRETLRGLNKANLGERIEEFYSFLLKERERLRHEGKSGAMIVPASRSSFLLSLFAFWLDPEKQPIIYYDSLRKGLYTLIKAGAVPESPGLVLGSNAMERGVARTFRGQWLVIDEFNRAPIDLALGDALTALGGHDVLRVAIESGSAELPIPQDFRIIGTLNSFDRNYLNQISEALKRRFSFIEILPPTRAQRAAEQGIVLYKALKKMGHLSNSIQSNESSLYWSGVVNISVEPSGHYSILWDDEQSAFRDAFDVAWRTFEIIRIYRQLGTAQAISLIRQMVIAGILQGHTTQETWIEHALDTALCSTIADQLQVLLPDEIESLFLYLITDPAAFRAAYHQLLARLASTPQRLYGQLLALGSVHDEQNHPYLSDAQIDRIAALDQPEVPAAVLIDLFHLNHAISPLPQFTRRLRTFKAERGL